MTDNRAQGDDDAKSDESDSGPEGDACGVGAGGEMRFCGGDLAEEERGHEHTADRMVGQPTQAVDQYRDLVNDYLRVLGHDHPSTLTTRASLAFSP